MNTKILIAAVKIIPKKLQYRAICKALNLLLAKPLSQSKGKAISISVTDLNKKWFVTIDNNGFTPLIVDKNADIDINVEASIGAVMAAQRKSRLLNAINSEQIKITGAAPYQQEFLEAIKSIEQPKIDGLVQRGYRYLRMKPPVRLNLSTVTLEDVECQKDVDFIRDQAVLLESSNLEQALRLMEIAHKARPEGPFIKGKLFEYRKKLS
ncbi:hypothetical protein [Pseudoalteromonas sp. NCIMB_1079]|uniref:SCP2 sterol-binding domain-containing protein n=1 Tax=Pseudoalteromonas sp. NCIMB 1079 TaxID=3142847 RepID=UPI00339BA8B6